MPKKLVQAWIISSFVIILVAEIWKQYDPENTSLSMIKFYAVLSSLLSVGYYSTPSNSVYGKISFGFVLLLVIGIMFKVLHYEGADAMVVIGLAGLLTTFAWRWKKEKKIF